MDKFQKSSLTVNGNSVRLSMPFAKVDEAKRLVSGYATLDNIDSQGDVVLAEASIKAFSRARGNIREMHQPIAAGRIVDFREDEFFHKDPVTGEGKFYRGIFVTARVSEGAESTWTKVLDGTLSGFSIGGEIIEDTTEFVKEAGKSVRFIKDYDLVELSLVDNPANQLANVLSIQKSATGSVTVTMGEVADANIENVFICRSDDTVVVKDAESQDCPLCGLKMENAGWFEAGKDRTEKVSDIVTKFLNPEEANTVSSSEGGVEMSKSETPPDKEVGVVNPSEEYPDGEKIEESEETSVEVEETNVEEETDVDDSNESAETDLTKRLDDLQSAITQALTENHSETSEKVASLESKIDAVHEGFKQLESRVSDFDKRLETAKSNIASMEKMIDKINSADAMKKSAELTNEPVVKNVQKKTSWNGAFSGKSNGFSVDDLM